MIHGAEAFSNYEAFLEHLKTVPIEDPLDERVEKKWKSSFKEELREAGYEIYTPRMPNSQNAKYDEWKIWFLRYHEFLHDGVILIGHSQGGYFLTKYLSENTMPVKVRALYLLAAPFEPDDFGGEDGGDFNFNPQNLPTLEGQVGEIFIFHSEDDPVVSYQHARKYSTALPSAKLVSFTDKNHFILEEFPELVDSVRSLSDS